MTQNTLGEVDFKEGFPNLNTEDVDTKRFSTEELFADIRGENDRPLLLFNRWENRNGEVKNSHFRLYRDEMNNLLLQARYAVHCTDKEEPVRYINFSAFFEKERKNFDVERVETCFRVDRKKEQYYVDPHTTIGWFSDGQVIFSLNKRLKRNSSLDMLYSLSFLLEQYRLSSLNGQPFFFQLVYKIICRENREFDKKLSEEYFIRKVTEFLKTEIAIWESLISLDTIIPSS